MVRNIQKNIFTFPEELKEEVAKLVDRVDPDVLLMFAKNNPEIAKGFQIKKENLPILRRRLANLLTSSSSLSHELVMFLRDFTLYRDIICVLSEQAIENLLEQFLIIYGAKEFLIGMFLDDREKVRELAEGYFSENKEKVLSKKKSSEPEMIRKALEEIREIMNPFIVSFKKISDGVDVSDISPVDSNRIEELIKKNKKFESKIGKLEEQLEEFNTLKKSEKKLQKRVDVLSSENEKLSALYERYHKRVEDLNSMIKEKESQLDESEKKYTHIKENFDKEVAKCVESELKNSIHAWLEKPIILEKTAENIKSSEKDDLIRETRAVLERQKEIDRHLGNIKVIEKRIEELSKLRDEVKRALAESLNPLPELKSLEEKLGKEITKLEILINYDEKHTPLLLNFLSKINSMTEEDEIKRMRQCLRDLEILNIPDRKELKMLYQAFQQRMSVLYEKYLESPLGKKDIFRGEAGWELANAIYSNFKILLLLDGHNIIFNMKEIFGPYYEDGIPGEKAREHLVKLICEIMQGKRSEVRIYFDGPERKEISHTDNITEIYSGKSGEHRADNAILEYLEFCRLQKYEFPIILVTDDHNLGEQAEKLRALWMSLAQFMIFLK